jgi:flagellar biosynthesis protein FlhB
MITAAVVIRSQVGNLFATEKLKPDITKLGPAKILEGLKNTLNIFSPRNLVELLKNILKVLIVGSCG